MESRYFPGALKENPYIETYILFHITHLLISTIPLLPLIYVTVKLCGPIQASKTYLNKLFILQKRTLRFIYFSDRRDHAIPLFLNAHILPINFIQYKLLAETMHDVSNGLVPSNLKDLFVPTAKMQPTN